MDYTSLPLLSELIVAGEAALSVVDECGLEAKESTWSLMDLLGESSEERLERLTLARKARMVIAKEISSLKRQRNLAYLRVACWSDPGRRCIETLVRCCVEWWRPAGRSLGIAWVEQGSLREVPWEKRLLKCLLVVAVALVRYSGDGAEKGGDRHDLHIQRVAVLDYLQWVNFSYAFTDDSFRDVFDRLARCRLIATPGRGG